MPTILLYLNHAIDSHVRNRLTDFTHLYGANGLGASATLIILRTMFLAPDAMTTLSNRGTTISSILGYFNLSTAFEKIRRTKVRFEVHTLFVIVYNFCVKGQ